MEVLQVVVAIVIISHKGFYLMPQLFFNFRMFSNQINHHLEIIGKSVSSSHEKIAKFIHNIVFSVVLIVPP